MSDSNHLLLDHYAGERADLEAQIQALHGLAFSREDKNFTDEEKTQLGILQDRMERVNGSIEAAAKVAQLSAQARAALQRGAVSADNSTHEYGSEGAVLWDLFNRGRDEAAGYRWNKAMDRAAQHMGTTAAGTTPVAGGFDGLIVLPTVGPIVRLFPDDMPFLSLIGTQPLVGAGGFLRPRIIDPDFYTVAGPHAGGLEKAEVPSKKWDYAADTVKGELVSNYINLSYEAIEWGPGNYQATVDHLRARTEAGLEARAVAEAAKTTKKVTLAAAADAAAVQKAVWDAMAAVYTATGRPATWMVAGPLGLAMLGSKTDLAGRPIFPQVGPVNANGTSAGFSLIQPFNLRFAVTHAIADTTLYVGNAIGLEAYVRRLPLLEAIEPSVLGRQIAAAAQVAFFHPTTTESPDGGTTPAKYEAIVKLAP